MGRLASKLLSERLSQFACILSRAATDAPSFAGTARRTRHPESQPPRCPLSATATTRREPRTGRAPDAPHSIYHDSFDDLDAREMYDPAGAPDVADFADRYMPDEVTRDYAKRMHYAAYRWKRAKGVAMAA